ncbi:hypothetical protein ROZALSC1DRAFT_27604 [Rozella allomycis CSF55]|uniref:ELM2 domain-containing protein n=1 Tax=Rozella allomycis (strain CSF55) TaxID=988480 RepID=A0A075AQQ1_ROZAC|nr:hypothetical protein O9G_004132 [Rozella allomycis CSF55]RKP20953.1 hypothetical protein ROZALSC1DRAFT_27604 [Rozella allomycis CSF55]|eukprot:EPZ32558.1 hypothetical protein O9G_004132 [Rozella allomycis CSF55]
MIDCPRKNVRIGEEYQARIPQKISHESHLHIPNCNSKNENVTAILKVDGTIECTKVWDPVKYKISSLDYDIFCIVGEKNFNGDCLDLCLSLLHIFDYNPRHVYSIINPCLSAKGCNVVSICFKDDWSISDQKKFQKCIEIYGKRFDLFKNDLPSKKITDIVKFYYHWKKSNYYEIYKSSRPKMHTKF